MALIAPTAASISGTLATYAAAAGGGDTIAPNDHGIFTVRNGGGAPITVTIAVPGNTKYGLAQPDVATAIAAGAERDFGPFPADLADPADNLVHITYSGVATVTVKYVTH